MKKIIFIFILAILGGMGYDLSSWATEYPSKAIQLVVPYPPASGVDLSSKVIIPYMEKYLRQPFVPIYKSGGDTSIGAKYVIASKPDGYTVFVTSQVTFTLFPKIIQGANYGINDITPIFGYAEMMLYVAVRNDAPWNTLADFIADAKKHPNKFKHGSWGLSSFGHLGMALINKYAGIQTIHVPFTGAAQALNALMGGHIDIAVSLGIIKPFVNAGKLRCLAVSSTNRTDLMPGIPTLTELGYPIVISFNHGFYVPNGTSQEIRDKIIQAGQKAFLEHPEELKKRFLQISVAPAWLNEEAYKKIIQDGDRLFDYVIDLLKLPTYQKK